MLKSGLCWLVANLVLRNSLIPPYSQGALRSTSTLDREFASEQEELEALQARRDFFLYRHKVNALNACCSAFEDRLMLRFIDDRVEKILAQVKKKAWCNSPKGELFVSELRLLRLEFVEQLVKSFTIQQKNDFFQVANQRLDLMDRC